MCDGRKQAGGPTLYALCTKTPFTLVGVIAKPLTRFPTLPTTEVYMCLGLSWCGRRRLGIVYGFLSPFEMEEKSETIVKERKN